MANRLKSLKGTYDVSKEKLTTSVEAEVTENCKLIATHQQDGGLVSAVLDGKQWRVGYFPEKKNLVLSMKKKFEGFSLKMTQEIPDLEWPLLPSPLLEIDTQLVDRNGLTDDLELKYDMRTRKAGVKQKLKKGRHECVWAVDSAQRLNGASLGWKTKFDKPGVKSLAASYARNVGPVVSYQVETSNKTEIEAKYSTRSQTIRGEFTYQPEDMNNAEIGLAMSKSLKDDKKPKAAVFLKWKF